MPRNGVVFTLLLVLAGGVAAEPRVQSAYLNRGSKPLTAVLTPLFRGSHGGNFTIHMATDVGPRGRLSYFRVVDSNDRALPRGFFRAVKKARVRPARIDARPVRVGVNAILFVSWNETTGNKVSLVQHSGYEHPGVGWNYIGPQVQGGYRKLYRMMNGWAGDAPMGAVVAFDLGSHGDKTAVLILRDSHSANGLGVYWSKQLVKSRFINARGPTGVIHARSRWSFAFPYEHSEYLGRWR
ncbi:MAG: hypothetical protein AAF438_10910 [Pseudomonadota bacterium]